MSLSIFISVVSTLAFIIIGLIVLILRGGTFRKKNDGSWEIETPAPGQEIIRDNKGKVFIEYSLMAKTAEELGDVKAELKALPAAFLARALSIAEMNLDIVIRELEIVVSTTLDATNPIEFAYMRMTSLALKQVKPEMMKELRRAYENNGFHDFRSRQENGDIASTKNWRTYITQEQMVLKGILRHEIIEKYPLIEKLPLMLSALENGTLSTLVDERVEEIFEAYWDLEDTCFSTQRGIENKKWLQKLDNIRKGETSCKD